MHESILFNDKVKLFIDFDYELKKKERKIK